MSVDVEGWQVRHPGVEEAIIRDFALMVGLAQAAEVLPILRRLRLQETLKQFAAPLREQVPPATESRLYIPVPQACGLSEAACSTACTTGSSHLGPKFII